MIFKCPECEHDADIVKKVSETVRVYLDDVGSGLKLWESDISRYYNITTYECGECGFRLPCRTDDDVINFVLKTQGERK